MARLSKIRGGSSSTIGTTLGATPLALDGLVVAPAQPRGGQEGDDHGGRDHHRYLEEPIPAGLPMEAAVSSLDSIEAIANSIEIAEVFNRSSPDEDNARALDLN